MDGHIMCCGIISSCQSAVTSDIVKRCCSWVWLTIASVLTFDLSPFVTFLTDNGSWLLLVVGVASYGALQHVSPLDIQRFFSAFFGAGKSL